MKFTVDAEDNFRISNEGGRFSCMYHDGCIIESEEMYVFMKYASGKGTSGYGRFFCLDSVRSLLLDMNKIEENASINSEEDIKILSDGPKNKTSNPKNGSEVWKFYVCPVCDGKFSKCKVISIFDSMYIHSDCKDDFVEILENAVNNDKILKEGL